MQEIAILLHSSKDDLPVGHQLLDLQSNHLGFRVSGLGFRVEGLGLRV